MSIVCDIIRNSVPEASRDGGGERYAIHIMYSLPPQVSDIHSLLSSQLSEPQIADIMHELQQHKDLQLV